MAYPDESVVQTWLDSLSGLNVRVKKMFGCYCVYCDNQPVGWLSESVFSLREVGLSCFPRGLKRPTREDRIQEIETRLAELDELLGREDIATDVARLMEINNEHETLDEELLQCMEDWESIV